MDVWLTTFDNPFDPFTQWDEWYEFDESNGYCTTGYIARLANYSEEMSDEDSDLAMNQAIDEIATRNFECCYKKIFNPSLKQNDVID